MPVQHLKVQARWFWGRARPSASAVPYRPSRTIWRPSAMTPTAQRISAPASRCPLRPSW